MIRPLKVLECIHATLVIALFIPLVYALCDIIPPEGTVLFYLKCLLVAVPVTVTRAAADRVRTLGGYMLVCGALLAVIYGIIAGGTLLAGPDGFEELPALCYRFGMLAETALIAGIRLVARIRRGRWEAVKKTDPLAVYEGSFLDRPSLHNCCFIVMYLAGIFLDAKPLCDIALFSAVVYLFPALAHTFFTATEHYLTLNKRTKGVPRRRLYAVGGGMLCLYAMLLLVVCLPSFLLINARKYTDIREWFTDMPMAPADQENHFEYPSPGTDMGDMPEFFVQDAAEAPGLFWEALLGALGIACLAVCAWAVIAVIRRIFRDFRMDLDDNGDKIEDLGENAGERRAPRALRETDIETVRIRRLYKRTIRKHRRDRPAPYETPAEMEEKAGLANDTAMRTLHADYERVRYGKP